MIHIKSRKRFRYPLILVEERKKNVSGLKYFVFFNHLGPSTPTDQIMATEAMVVKVGLMEMSAMAEASNGTAVVEATAVTEAMVVTVVGMALNGTAVAGALV